MKGVSDSVLEALARALQLDEAERAHLFDLARALRPTSLPQRSRVPRQRVRPSNPHTFSRGRHVSAGCKPPSWGARKLIALGGSSRLVESWRGAC